MSSVDIPDIVIGRLPLYLRALSRLTLEGAKITSSHELGKRLGISSAQIRKDLSHFGEFGKQGTGYQVDYLTEQLRQILRVDKEWRVALVGVGDLGRALAHYNGFRDRGFRITMLFDNDPAKVSTMLDGFQIYDVAQMKDLIRRHGITLAMIAVPAEAAQQVADALVAAGVRGLLNYAPINIAVPEGVKVQYIDPVVHLQRITYYVEE
jgi:redox-sensing transcriptional repressor